MTQAGVTPREEVVIQEKAGGGGIAFRFKFLMHDFRRRTTAGPQLSVGVEYKRLLNGSVPGTVGTLDPSCPFRYSPNAC